MLAHQLLDEGLDFCEACESTTPAGAYCGHCGAQLFDPSEEPQRARDPRACPKCRHVDRMTYCPACGTQVVPEDVVAVERGEKTWEDVSAESDAMWDRIRARQSERERELEAVARWGG